MKREKIEKAEAGVRLVPDSVPDWKLLPCKLEREIAPARQGKNSRREVLRDSLRPRPGLARRLKRDELIATGIVWQVVEA